MVIHSRTIFAAAAALTAVGAALWGSSLLSNPSPHPGSVEVEQLLERSWGVEVKDLGAVPVKADKAKTAAVKR